MPLKNMAPTSYATKSWDHPPTPRGVRAKPYQISASATAGDWSGQDLAEGKNQVPQKSTLWSSGVLHHLAHVILIIPVCCMQEFAKSIVAKSGFPLSGIRQRRSHVF